MGRAAAGENRQDGADFEKGSPPARKSCSDSSQKQAVSPTAAAGRRPGPRDLAAGAPGVRCWVHRLGARLAGRCRSSPEGEGRRCEQVSETAGSDKAAPGGSGGERRWPKYGLGEKRAGAAG